MDPLNQETFSSELLPYIFLIIVLPLVFFSFFLPPCPLRNSFWLWTLYTFLIFYFFSLILSFTYVLYFLRVILNLFPTLIVIFYFVILISKNPFLLFSEYTKNVASCSCFMGIISYQWDWCWSFYSCSYCLFSFSSYFLFFFPLLLSFLLETYLSNEALKSYLESVRVCASTLAGRGKLVERGCLSLIGFHCEGIRQLARFLLGKNLISAYVGLFYFKSSRRGIL